MKPLDLILLAPDSWRPQEPTTGRGSNRTSERELDRVQACLAIGPIRVPVKLWDYSPFGFSVLASHASLPQGAGPGSPADLVLSIGDILFRAGCRMENAAQFKGQLRIGLSRCDLEAEPPAGGDRLQISDSVLLWGETRNPLLYGEWCSMRLVAVRSGMRLVFASTDPALVLFQGMEMDVELGMPTSGDNVYRGRVASMGRLPGEAVCFVLEPIRVSAKLAAEMAELLAAETASSPMDLKVFGFPVTFLRERLRFRHADGEADFLEVEKLMRETAREDGMPPPRPARLRSPGSRVLCGFHEETLVAAVLLAFPGDGRNAPGGDEAESSGAGSRMEILELATHPEYCRGDFWLALVERICRIFLLSGRRWLARSCEERLLPVYRNMGFREAGGADGTHRRVRLHRDTVLFGSGLGLPAWTTLYGDLVRDFLDKGLVAPSPWRALALRSRLRLKAWFQARSAERAERIFQLCIRK